MTTGAQLISRVRSNINEPNAAGDEPLRTDTEILRWLSDAQLDYVKRVPANEFPELIKLSETASASLARPADFISIYSAFVTHTISGTFTETVPATILGPDEDWLKRQWPGNVGGYCQMRSSNVFLFGPNATAGGIFYLGAPTVLSATNSVLDLGSEHEEPLVNYASAMAQFKANDEDAATYMQLYERAIEARGGKVSTQGVERA